MSIGNVKYAFMKSDSAVANWSVRVCLHNSVYMGQFRGI